MFCAEQLRVAIHEGAVSAGVAADSNDVGLSGVGAGVDIKEMGLCRAGFEANFNIVSSSWLGQR